MNLFVRGAGFRNKGAHLMLHAIREETDRWGDVRLSMDPRTGTRSQRRGAGCLDHGALELTRLPWVNPLSAGIGNLIPKPLREGAGFLADRDLDGVLDASGFSYSDQWGTGSIGRMLDRSRAWRRRAIPIVFLPQAFGPFENPENRRAFQEIADAAALVFVRDKRSMAYLTELGVEEGRLRMAPDFTCLVEGGPSQVRERIAGRPCLIPNYRMVDKRERSSGETYLRFLEACARRLLDAGTDPYALIHDHGGDADLVDELGSRLGRRLETIIEDDPVIIKGIVGSAQVVIGSRYHGLVSALGQGVPAIGTSWSHKYRELFREFDCEAFLLGGDQLARSELAATLVDELLDGRTRDEIISRLLEVADSQKARTREMWRETREALEGTLGSAAAA